MSTLSISLAEYHRRVYASWIGQCVGNMFGLGYENLFIDEPMPQGHDPVWAPWVLDLIRQADGAFSDDDTDIEYMYLLAMEAARDAEGLPREVTYEDLVQRWRHHVRSHVWVANRAALGLMHHGVLPPWTGRRALNPHWFQIDAQLVNEIWGLTAPGMLRCAADRCAWAARVMADDWGLEPTIHYGVMYAGAFFESDVRRLVERACMYLPEDGRFVRTVRHMLRLHADYPRDWRPARRELCDAYYHREDPATKTIWNANLNGAAGILALLYGNGDFRCTLEMCCRMGFDTDNQAATMCGLVAIITGLEGIPQDLLFPLPDRKWREPLNDRYHNRTRHDLPDASLIDMGRRLAEQGVAFACRAGGRVDESSGELMLCVPRDATFLPPPVPAAPSVEDRFTERDNLASRASRVLCQVDRLDEDALRRMIVFTPRALLADTPDVFRHQATALVPSLEASSEPRSFYGFVPADRECFYGYEFADPQRIACVVFRVGTLEEIGGWFADPRIEYLVGNDRAQVDAAWVWEAVREEAWSPAFPAADEPLHHAPWISYRIVFQPVESRAVRIIGRPGGSGGFVSIAALAVFGEDVGRPPAG